tara:strand:+ start:394 stop:939 length:546 start_codon:yes stop_codon:yes gene_type:complete
MLEILAKQHDDWIRIAYGMTNDMEEAKDLVQDMYVVVLERVSLTGKMYNTNQANRYYIWKVIRSVFIDNMRKTNSRKNVKTIPLIENADTSSDVDFDYSENDAFDSIHLKINDLTKEWGQYDRKLFELYFLHGQSLRQIANGANIGLNSIHNSVKGYREAIKAELSEDLQDYFNQDYDKID